MRVCLVLCVAAALVAAARADCDACLDGHCYKKHLLPGTSYRYGALYRKTNTLYHYYRNSADEEFIIKCDLDKATCNDTAKISHVLDLTVDQRTGDVYGTFFDYRGIYKLDFANAKKVLWVPVSTVWLLTFKDHLYYTTIDGGINVFKNGTSHLLAGTKQYNVKHMIVDRDNDIYFYDYTSHGRFLKMLSKGVIYKSGFWDHHDFKMTTDKDGNAIFIDQNTHAVYRVINGQPNEIGAVSDWVDKPLFDRDNNLVYYEFNSNDDIEAWHFKKERNSACSVSNEGAIRTITETVVSNEDKQDVIPNKPSDTEPANGSSSGRSGGNNPETQGTHPSKWRGT